MPCMWKGRPCTLLVNCFKMVEDKLTRSGEVKKESERTARVKCYNCGQLGHISTNCPEKALYCGAELVKHAMWRGM